MMETNQTDREAVDDLFERAKTTYKEGDLEGFLDCFDDNVVCLPPAAPPVIGKEAWRGVLSSFWGRSQLLEHDINSQVNIEGDWAIEWHTERQLTVPADGGDQSESFYKGIWTLRRQADNSWKIAHYCWNSAPGLS
jgi:uncharacterized protein (TIGR02246 family)